MIFNARKLNPEVGWLFSLMLFTSRALFFLPFRFIPMSLIRRIVRVLIDLWR